jgi:hypothetical protein
MSKKPVNMTPKDQKTFLAIKQGIREEIPQKALGPYIGFKKSYVGWFLNKYGINWKELKAEILSERPEIKKPVYKRKPKKASPSQSVKPIESQNEVNDKKCQNMTKTVKPISSKITDIDMNAEEFYIDPNIINNIGPDAIASDNNNDSDTHDTIQHASEITEDLYKAVLLEHVKQASNSEHGIKVQTLTELRNYLDKTEKLLSEKKELSVDKIKFEEMKVNSDNAINEAIDFMNSEEFKKTIPKKHEME